jgi:hypothetical protein
MVWMKNLTLLSIKTVSRLHQWEYWEALERSNKLPSITPIKHVNEILINIWIHTNQSNKLQEKNITYQEQIQLNWITIENEYKFIKIVSNTFTVAKNKKILVNRINDQFSLYFATTKDFEINCWGMKTSWTSIILFFFKKSWPR